MPEARLSDEVVLSVVVPVYNQAGSIAENVRVILERVASGLGGATEVIVVSDGSLDDTQERALEVTDDRTKVLHYDRNMGKGYAVKLGVLEARGRWVGYVDADLDLDPALLPSYVARAEAAGLDFAIGSKRHPASDVAYPPARRFASSLFQLLVRALFRLDVRDTQVGIKLFSRDVADQVVPLLLVKRFAFDIELLAVARALGFDRIEEQPIRLDYRFTGSGVRSLAVLRALLDTAAIFYRLRILHYYERKQRLVGRFGWTRPRERLPGVALVGDPAAVDLVDYPELVFGGTDLHEVAASTDAPLLAILEPGAVPATNWLSATVPFVARPEIGAVVTPAVAPGGGDPREKGAAAIRESRLGGGLQYFRFLPGNLRYVDDYATGSVVVRTELVRSLLAGVEPQSFASALAAEGIRVLYTPEASISARPERLFRPHLGWVHERGRHRGRAVRLHGAGALRLSSLPPLALALFAAGGWALLLVGRGGQSAWLALWLTYFVAVLLASAVVVLRFRSLRVALLAAPGFVLTHVVYARGFISGLTGW